MTDGTKWRRTKGLLAQGLGAHGVVAPFTSLPVYHTLHRTFEEALWYFALGIQIVLLRELTTKVKIKLAL
jgi:VanZ family protein